jgi:WD40 repeat protein
VDLESGQVVTLGLEGKSIYYAIMHPEQPYVVTADNNGDVRLWDLSAGKEAYRSKDDSDPLAAHTGSANSLDFTSTGDLLVSGGTGGKVLLWEVANHRLKAEWQGSTKMINSIQFSPDDRKIALADDRGRVEFFLVDSDELVEYARAFRVTRSLTGEECRQYDLIDTDIGACSAQAQ